MLILPAVSHLFCFVSYFLFFGKSWYFAGFLNPRSNLYSGSTYISLRNASKTLVVLLLFFRILTWNWNFFSLWKTGHQSASQQVSRWFFSVPAGKKKVVHAHSLSYYSSAAAPCMFIQFVVCRPWNMTPNEQPACTTLPSIHGLILSALPPHTY